MFDITTINRMNAPSPKAVSLAKLESELISFGMALEVPRDVALVEFQNNSRTSRDLDNALGKHDTYRAAEVLFALGY